MLVLTLAGCKGVQTGGAIGANDGPLVGESVGAVMPLTSWSLSDGDHRIAHFLGIHAMQALPPIAFAKALGITRWLLRRARHAAGSFRARYLPLRQHHPCQ